MVSFSAVWPDSHIEALKAFIALGGSAREIAAQLNGQFRTGYSRCAVIGKAKRMGLMLIHNTGSHVIKAAKPESAKTFKMPRALPPHAEIRLRCAAVEPRHLSVLDLGADTCRWPYGDRNFTFCGHLPFLSRPYCEAHFLLSLGGGTESERQAEKPPKAA